MNKDAWILYYSGFGTTSAVGMYETAEEAKAAAGIGKPIAWKQTNERGDAVGLPFNGEPPTPFFFTINQDGEAVYKALTRVR